MMVSDLKSSPENPSQPPFAKGRRYSSPFRKGGLRGIKVFVMGLSYTAEVLQHRKIDQKTII
jgi:hypothetical protein